MQFDLMLRIHLDDDDEGMSRLIIEQLRTDIKAMHTCGNHFCCVHVISSHRTRQKADTELDGRTFHSFILLCLQSIYVQCISLVDAFD